MSDAGNKDNSTARIGRRKLALLLKLAAALAVLAVLLIILDFCSYPLLNPPERSAAFNKGCNGIWLRYYWYRGKHSDAEFKVMLQKLRRGQIKYAFFHVLRVNPDGSLKYKNVQNACKITDGIHKEAQGVKAIAWVYVPSRLNGPDGADLSQPGVRRNLIEVAKWLVRDCHFDGVQWDYEFCANRDASFLLLLDETQEAFRGLDSPGSKKMLSIATPMWYPFTLWGWDDAYFKEAGKRCDQIAVMCYDSFFYLPTCYVWLVHQQVVHVTRSVKEANPSASVLLGIPVYDGGTLGHVSQTENICASLKGVQEGLLDKRSEPSVFEGVAPFAEYTMDETEWQQYCQWWLGQSSRATTR